ncbi:di-trans,poly-cis-decaprenylcistransferase [Candidatus Dojkabacteria bacterium]|nr:di-trans,poly-cis-decaprenylcistransferase [Candidatus Dojkabacteria bacterium]
MKEIKAIVKGRVQGVNYRRRTKKFADEIGLTGWVKNEKNGSVRIIAQGEIPEIKQFITLCQTDSFPIQVDAIEYEIKEISSKYKAHEFSIIREENIIKDQIQSYTNFTKGFIKAEKEIQIPVHIVIIPDGNRRWARKRGLQVWLGHEKSVQFERIIKFYLECKEIGVRYLTFWALSTENWKKRDETEVSEIFNLFRKGENQWTEFMVKEQMRFRHIGRKDRMPKDIIEILERMEQTTEKFDTLNVQFALDYGGRDEIVRATNKILNDKPAEVTIESFKKYLDTRDYPDPDLIIRTGGEKRLSGLMPYVSDYAELYFTDTLFPDFDLNEFRYAISDFGQRIRRFGGDSEKDKKK